METKVNPWSIEVKSGRESPERSGIFSEGRAALTKRLGESGYLASREGSPGKARLHEK